MPRTTRSNAVFASNRTIASTIDGNGTNATADRTGMVPVDTTDGNGKNAARPNADHTGMTVPRPTDFDPSIALASFDPSTFETTEMIPGSTDFHPPNKNEMDSSMLFTTRPDSNRTGTVHGKRGTFDSNIQFDSNTLFASTIAADGNGGTSVSITNITATADGNGGTSTIPSTGKSNHNEEDGKDKDDDADNNAGSYKENTKGGAKSHTSSFLSGNTNMMKITSTDAAIAAAAAPEMGNFAPNQTMVRYSSRRSSKKLPSVLATVLSAIIISLLLLSDTASALPGKNKSKTPPPPPEKKTSRKTSKNSKHSRAPNPPPSPPPTPAPSPTPTRPPTTPPTTISLTYTACLDVCPNSSDLCAKQCAALDSCIDDIASTITPYQETWDTFLTGGINLLTAQMVKYIGTFCCPVCCHRHRGLYLTLCWRMYIVYCSSTFIGRVCAYMMIIVLFFYSPVAMFADVVVSCNDSHRRHRGRIVVHLKIPTIPRYFKPT